MSLRHAFILCLLLQATALLPGRADSAAPPDTGGKPAPTQPAVPPYGDWPAAPFGGKPLFYHERGTKKILWHIAMAGPSFGFPPEDKIDDVTTDQSIKGILVYGVMAGAKYPIGENEYLVLAAVNLGEPWSKPERCAANYHFSRYFPPWGAQLSGDGRILLFRVGMVARRSGFALYGWDIAHGTFNLIEESENVESWNAYSHDGHYWAWNEALLGDESSMDIGPADLAIADTTQEYAKWLITHLASRGPLAWTSNNKLLYSYEPPSSTLNYFKNEHGQRQLAGTTATVHIDAPEKYPAVWMADPEKKQARQVIERGCRPSPSPDGRWIAFAGWALGEKPTPEKPAGPPGVWLYDVRNGQTHEVLSKGISRQPLARQQYDGDIVWAPDSSKLVLLQYDSPYIAHISVLPVADALAGPEHAAAARKELAVVSAKDFQYVERIYPLPITVQGVSRNGKYLVLDLAPYIGMTPDKEKYLPRHTMEAVDLTDGHITVIASHKPMKQFFTWSWFDESDAPPAAASTTGLR